MSELRSALESNDVERIKSAEDALQQSAYKLSQILYEQTAAQAQASSPGAQSETPGGNGQAQDEDEGVIDAEFKAE